MSLKRNVLANYASQIFVSFANIVMVPMYVQYMGAEAFGLVGFFGMLQAWFQLVDVGLSPTMARETARFNGGATDAASLRRLLRALEGIFALIAVVGSLGFLFGADVISSKWVRAQQLPVDEVRHAIMFMGVAVSLRWVSGLYRGAVIGFEHLTWLSCFNIGIATARFVLVIPVLIYFGTGPVCFFSYQLGVAILELVVLIAQVYRLLPKPDALAPKYGCDFRPIRDVLKFSLSVAFTSSLWVFVTQTDKLLLSKLLPLSDYGYFTLAVLLASGVTMISGPISNAVMPRLTRLAAARDDAALVELYRNATQAVAVVSLATAFVLAFFADEILWIWTGDRAIAREAGSVMALYSLGNGILAFAAFPYYFQFAKGDLRLHLQGNLLFACFLLPSVVFATYRYGAVGAGCAWIAANAAYVLIWIPRIHGRFVKGLHWKWLIIDVVAVAVTAAIGCFLVRAFLRWPDERVPAGIVLVAVSAAILLAAAAGSSLIRKRVKSRLIRSYAV